MTASFRQYAEIYDLLYSDKNYAEECSFVEGVFRKFAEQKLGVKHILDVSVGTGGHAIVLAQRGYELTGFDYSEEMARIAREKAENAGVSIPIQGGVSMAKLPPMNKKFDAVLSLFASVNYLCETGELGSFVKGAQKNLRPGGLLMFDYWSGIACLREPMSAKTKDVSRGSMRVLRASRTMLQPMRNRATVTFDCKVFEGDHLQREFSENHELRYFFPQEVVDLVESSGFEVLATLPFMILDRQARDNDWYLTLVARKKQDSL